MYRDTEGLWKPFLIVFSFRAFFLFLSINNPLSLAALILYIIAIQSILKDGQRFKLIYLASIIDFTSIVFFSFVLGSTAALLLIGPLVTVVVFSIYLSEVINKEYLLFKRTVKSFNDDDVAKARIALKSMNPRDVAKVAEYTDWKSIN